MFISCLRKCARTGKLLLTSSTSYIERSFSLGIRNKALEYPTNSGNFIRVTDPMIQACGFTQSLVRMSSHLAQYANKHLNIINRRRILSDSFESDILENETLELSDFLPPNFSEVVEDIVPQRQRSLFDEEEEPEIKRRTSNVDLEKITVRDINVCAIPVQIGIQPTNSITYFRGIVNVSELSDELKSMLPLFTQVVTNMITKKYDHYERSNLNQNTTGGINCSLHFAEDIQDVSLLEEGIMIQSCCLEDNSKEMFNLLTEVFNNVTFNDTERFKTLVRMSEVQLRKHIKKSFQQYATSCAGSLVSGTLRRKELCCGLSYVETLRKIVQLHDLSPVLQKMNEIASSILNKRHIRCALNVSQDHLDDSIIHMEEFINSLPGPINDSFRQTKVQDVPSSPTSVRHFLPILENHIAKSYSTVPYCNPDFAPLQVLARLLTSKYLYPLLRDGESTVGAGVNLSSSGVFTFHASCDSDYTDTFTTFDAAGEWVHRKIHKYKFIEEAKLEVIRNMSGPIYPGFKGMNRFLFRIDDNILLMHRNAVMDVTMDDIVRVSQHYLNPETRRSGRAVLGPHGR